MSYYLRVLPDNSSLHAWKITEGVAYRIGVPNPEQQPEAYFEAAPGRTIWETLQIQTRWFEPAGTIPFQRAELEPGQYYRRIARPIEQHFRDCLGWSPGAHTDGDSIAVARSQLSVLTRQLGRICQTVQPTVQTFGAFGHDIRNLLILACTEVEAHWRGVFIANGFSRDRYSTNDYLRLLRPMRLDEYAVTFPNYPWLNPVQPFAGWGSTGKPTQDLQWYGAYNAVKHNREGEFERATLRAAFEAVSACVIMMGAQFGIDCGFTRSSEVESFFRLSAFPNWLPSEVYIYPYAEVAKDWSPIRFPF